MQALRAETLEKFAEYHDVAFAPREFVPAEVPVPVSGKVFGKKEVQQAVDAARFPADD